MTLRQRTALAISAVLVSFVWLQHDHILSLLGGFLDAGRSPEKADIAVVLAGDFFGHRVLTAGDLVRNGYAPIALVSGPGGEYDFHECDLAIPFAVKRGYSASYFAHFENDARSTASELGLIAAELHRRNAHKILLVTSNYHTRRATELFHRVAPDLTVIPISAPDEFFAPESWWRNREARKTFLTEWQKTFAVWLRL